MRIIEFFEPQWREVLLLWLGRNYQNELNDQKEQLLNALVDFEDGCSDVNLYGYHANLLAAVGIAEFCNFNRAEEVVVSILAKASVEIEIFNNPFAAAARKTLQEMKPSMLSDTLAVTTCNTNRSNLQSRHLQTRINCNYNYTSARINCN
ncbi:hypothetical protein [Nostoc sp. 'Peltigera malacea cyanobiont' DB3992]|uniref:hypothetical protein n=1 Tax=Nostoc sp. 'Peltigera malacea cyanobiont' DB3992 TaxID=1206980 RepID=UPI000C0498DA|nr:hypothetical protein [Nostoc sp. 'Peltigera malacea cyanobiont' DB3992]PHM05995.1 hypothetical protein CK516_36855 [Nostoc sp. 'Peltigera malacea cyanobiont' DB3992]